MIWHLIILTFCVIIISYQSTFEIIWGKCKGKQKITFASCHSAISPSNISSMHVKWGQPDALKLISWPKQSCDLQKPFYEAKLMKMSVPHTNSVIAHSLESIKCIKIFPSGNNLQSAWPEASSIFLATLPPSPSIKESKTPPWDVSYTFF